MLATLNPAVGSGTIQVTAYFPAGGSSTTDIGSYIVSQRGSRQFKIHQLSDSSEAVYTLKAVAPASIVAGEFCVQVILSDSTVGYVSKFYNRTVHYVTAAGTTGTATYSLGTEATDEAQAASGAVTIDVM
jgi:hypothetical protein|tara:strand:- start:53 stop:442 length:390 start_codon:yes stop_codon:yes gene_type:complete